MKKFFLIVALIAISATSYAQHTQSRQEYYGVTNSSVTNYGTKTVADTAGATKDSIQIRPNNQISYYHVNLADSAILNLKSTAGCFYGDIIYLDIVNPAFTNKLVLGLNWIVSTGTTTISLTTSKSSLLKFWFNGSDFVEVSRNLNYTR